MFFRDKKLIPFDEFVGSNDALDFFKSQGLDTSQGIGPLRSAWENVPEVKDFLTKRQDYNFGQQLRLQSDMSGISPDHLEGTREEQIRRSHRNFEVHSLNTDRQPDEYLNLADIGARQFREHGYVEGRFADVTSPSHWQARSPNADPSVVTETGKQTSPGKILHGAKGGDLYTGGDITPSQQLHPEEVEKLRGSFVQCCYPADVKKKYPFLDVQNSDSQFPTWGSWFQAQTDAYSPIKIQPSIMRDTAILPVDNPEVKERIARMSEGGRALSPQAHLDRVAQGKKPAHVMFGGEEDLKRGWFTGTDAKDKTPLAIRKSINAQIDSGSLVQRTVTLGGDNKHTAPFQHTIIGQPGVVDSIEELFKKNEDLLVKAAGMPGDDTPLQKLRAAEWTPEIDEFRRKLKTLTGSSEDAIDLDSFLHKNQLSGDESLPVYSQNPYQVDKVDDFEVQNTRGTIDEAISSGLSPKQIKQNIIENSKPIGELVDKVDDFAKMGRTSGHPGVFEVKDKVAKLRQMFGGDNTVKKLAKISKIGGLALALGIGVPAVASASTGASPTDGGLGSTLAIGAGVATVAGVGAYSYSKIRKAGLNPRIAGGAAGGGAGAAGAGGGAAAGAAGTVNRNRGSRIYNSAFVQEELDLTTRGFFAGIGSVINDFGFNRRTGSFDTSGKPDSFVDSLFGRALKQDGYVHPVFRKEEAIWKVANNLQDAYQGWKDYINTSYHSSSGISKLFQGVRYHGFRALDSVGDGWLNKQLVKAGGFSTLIAPALMAQGAMSDFKEGYRRGGLIGGAFKTVTGLISGLVQNKVIAGILLNPATGLLGAGITAAAGYAAFKIFDVRNKGADYIRSGRMGGLSWNRGPTPGMSGSLAATARQRGLNAMNNSRFNAMKAMGNESYMMNAPKSRYANSTAIHGITPVLSY